LGNFSGFRQGTPDYERAINIVHDAALKASKRLCGPFAWRDRPDFTCFQAGSETAAIARGVAAGRPAALAHRAAERAYAGEHRDEVIEAARRAMADGELLRSLGEESYASFYAIEALHAVEAAEEADAVLRDAEAIVRRAGSPFMLATLAFMRPAWHRLFGDLRTAESQLRDSYELFSSAHASAGIHTTGVNLALTLLDRGDVDGADHLLSALPEREQGLGVIGLHGARARVHAERGRWDAALAEIELQYELERSRGHRLWPRAFLRVTHVQALLATERHDQALKLADAEIELHTARAARGHEAKARLSRAHVLSGEEAFAELELAATAAAASPMRIVEAHVLTELGAARRRGGQRTDAREPLRQARDLARRVGATGLEEQAHEELVIAGGRPQRVALAGVDALTPAERRVADLAAEGLSNKEIAEALFVTLKTVEVHLGRAYAKLGIKGRSQLPAALAAA
jgi:DNA-binding CsgD family transcriptional regulator